MIAPRLSRCADATTGADASASAPPSVSPSASTPSWRLTPPAYEKSRRARERAGSVLDDRADRGAGVHEVEPVVDARERQFMRDHRIDLDSLVHVPVDDARHVGAAACAAE